MKILFVDTENSSREKIQKLITYVNRDRNSYLASLNHSHFTTEDLLNELEVSKEMIEEISKSDSDDQLIIIVNETKKKLNQLSTEFTDSGNLEYKSFKINLDQEEVYINSKRIKLTALEYRLLLFFIYNAKKLIPRAELIDYLWGKGNKQTTSEDTMYTHIKNLKKKIIKSGIGNFIHTVYGQGYKFEDPEDIIA